MNVKKLREDQRITQRQLSEATGIPIGRINSWEQRGTEPKKKDYDILKEFFSYEEPGGKQKGIAAVPIKAHTSYIKNVGNVEYLSKLERIYFPNIPYDGDNFRFFQVEGKSMEYIDEATKTAKGIEDGAWVLVEKIPKEDWKENLRVYLVYVIVTNNRVTLKRVLRDSSEEVVLHADNEIYGQERLPLKDVQEIWIFRRKLDWIAPPPRKIEIKV